MKRRFKLEELEKTLPPSLIIKSYEKSNYQETLEKARKGDKGALYNLECFWNWLKQARLEKVKPPKPRREPNTRTWLNALIRKRIDE